MKKASSKTLSQLILLLLLSTFGIVLLVGLHLFFLSLIEDLDKETANLKSKIKIGEYIVSDLHVIRSDFYEFATTVTNNKGREHVKKRILKNINKIKNSLDVLENGGTLKRVIRLNIAGHNDTTETIKYDKYENSVSLESIDLMPKLIEFEYMIDELIALLKTQDTYRKTKNIEAFMKQNKVIKRYYKRTPPFFNRITENASRLLYEGSIELKKLEQEIEQEKEQYTKLELLIIIATILTVFVLGTIIALQINRNAKLLERQESSTRGILDAQDNIVVVSNGKYMIDANKSLIEFFDGYDSFEDFSDKHICICDFFEEVDEENYEYIIDKDYDGLQWFEYIIENNHRLHKVAMYKNEELNYFTITATRKDIDSNNFIIIVVLNNITKEIDTQQELIRLNDNLEDIVNEKTKELQELNENLEQKVLIEVEKNREKDKTMIQQARFAALGEMIGNIAHQWRQPLSAILSTVTSMQVQRELNIAKDEDIDKSFNSIIGYVNFLNHTIEDFRNFFKKDKEIVEFNILDILNNAMSITSAVYKGHQIAIVLDSSKDVFTSKGYPNELSQVFLNILNNAKDILKEQDIEKKIVHIKLFEENGQNVIEIRDNAKGIEEKILHKIFDPYFTTKHKSQGTGIGLYMSKNIIEKNMHGFIKASNCSFTLDKQTYAGACFRIELPKI